MHEFSQQIGAGYYVFIDSRYPRLAGDSASLVSPSLQARTTNCLYFWYHMWGSSIGSLQVFIRRDGIDQEVWNKTGNSLDEWQPGLVAIHVGNPFQVYC